MIRNFEKNLLDNHGLHPKQHIILAVSGGVDSIVLFHLMRKISRIHQPKLSIAHINHQLRPEADAEEAFVQELATTHNVPFYSYKWEESNHPASGLEEAARKVRYAFFKKVMCQTGADILMTGHHQDDQVETMLMRLVRGSSLEQLTGIHPSQPFNEGLLIRPLLAYSKAELYTFAEQNNLLYKEDKTNEGLVFSRNRYRNQIIPLLKEENAKFNEHMEQLNRDLTDVLEIADQPITEAFQKIVDLSGKSLSFDQGDFFNQSESMQRALLQKVLEKLYEHVEVSYKTNYIEIVRQWLLAGDVNTQLDLMAGFIVRKDYTRVHFLPEEKIELGNQNEQFEIKDLNQWVKISETESIGVFDSMEDEEDTETLAFHEGQVDFPLTVRHREPGDRMIYKGLSGSKKIKDILIDEKVPLNKRDEAWVVEDAKDVILWLISYRKMYLLSDEETDKLTYILKYQKNNN